jgi:phytoene dehydrogenase-like protein
MAMSIMARSALTRCSSAARQHQFGDYRSPIARLYQCGASTHPGGGVARMPGYNAAR